MLKVSKDQYNIRLSTSNGASYSLPIELVRGIKDGEISERYYQALDFLQTEQPSLEATVDEIKQLYEGNV